jgi:hypothetical protein
MPGRPTRLSRELILYVVFATSADAGLASADSRRFPHAKRSRYGANMNAIGPHPTDWFDGSLSRLLLIAAMALFALLSIRP